MQLLLCPRLLLPAAGGIRRLAIIQEAAVQQKKVRAEPLALLRGKESWDCPRTNDGTPYFDAQHGACAS